MRIYAALDRAITKLGSKVHAGMTPLWVGKFVNLQTHLQVIRDMRFETACGLDLESKIKIGYLEVFHIDCGECLAYISSWYLENEELLAP